MNTRIVRFVTVTAAAAVLSVMGSGLANASAADRLESQLVAATGQQNTHSVATYLGELRHYLNAAVSQNNGEAVEAAIKNLRPVLDAVAKAPVERAAAVLNDHADAQVAQVERELPSLSLLAPVTGLVTSLLMTLLDLVTSLLGDLPVSLPELPELPGLPGLPDLPLPNLPGLPLPEPPVELPDAPLPEPSADVPAPELPFVPAS